MPAKNEINLLVIAHPDDESMFFVPLIQNTRNNLIVICLTTGNYDGLGATRARELQAVSELFQFQHLVLVDDPKIPDHPSQRWDVHYVATTLQTKLQELVPSPDTRLNIFTFDKWGVSGHTNHRDTCQSVRHFVATQTYYTTVTLWEIQSIQNLFQKYLPLGAWWNLLGCWLGGRSNTARQDHSEDCIEYRCYRPSLNWAAMKAHQSQFVWYRRLFVIFSAFTYHNVFRKQRSKKAE